ncbi:hypothetical protein F8M41_002765 [Gigaspora margarita]|uniref:RecQ-mediated genome instability protein 1 n=1 Tax=Gigaspora margarita TaxID=4874 RepID=A0A8H3XCB5_GIGMA|nr:hypothetical protein F8M41_002765 [Gigaspora margarita]
MTLSSIKSQFETLHNVYLQDTWLQQHLENANLDNQRLYQAIYNEFLDSDLNKSMKPHLPPLIEDKHKIIIGEHQPIILQIADIFEVGVSAQSLLDVVNSYLSGSMKQGHKYNDLSDRQYESIQFPRGMLKFQLTDGYQSVDAIEYKPLSNLNLLTPIGIKISVSQALILRGVLLLGPENVTVLGGFTGEHRSINAIRICLLKQLGLPITDCSQEIQPNQEPESTNEDQRTQSNINPTDLITSNNTSTHSLSSQNEPFISLTSNATITESTSNATITESTSNATITETQSESQSKQNTLFQDNGGEMFMDDDLFNENVVWLDDSFIEEAHNTLHSPTSSPPILSSCDISPTEKTLCLSMLSQDSDELPSEDEAIASFSNKK